MKSVMLWLLAAVAIGQPLSARAEMPLEVTCGTLRQKITASIDIAAPVDKVWALIGNFQDSSWNPTVISAVGTGGNAPKLATRSVTWAGGHVVEESLEKYDADKRAYFYRINNHVTDFFPVNNFSAWVRVTVNGNLTHVEWKAAFNRGDMRISPLPGMDDPAAIAAVTDYLHHGLEHLKTLAESGT